MVNWHIYTDGGSRGNPGKSACAFVVLLDGTLLYEQGNYLGILTNNEAEYEALIHSLEWLLSQNTQPDSITWSTDSTLLANQINKQWKIKEDRLAEKAQKVWRLLGQLSLPYTISYVPREQNTAADALVNETLDTNSIE